MDIPSREEFLKGHKEFKQHEKRDAMYKVATFLVSFYWGKHSEMTNGLGVLLLTWNQAFYRYGMFDFDKLEKCIIDDFRKIESFKKRDIFTLSNADDTNIKNLFAKFLEALRIDTIKFSNKNERRDTKEDLEKFLSKIGVEFAANDDLKTVYNSIKNNQKIKNSVGFISKKETNSNKDYIEIKISKLGGEERETLDSLGLIKRSPVSVAKALHLLAPKFFPLWDQKIAKKYKCYYNENPAEKYVLFCKSMKDLADGVKSYVGESDEKLIKLIDEYNYSKYTKGWI